MNLCQNKSWAGFFYLILMVLLGPQKSMALAIEGHEVVSVASYNVENLWDANKRNTEDSWKTFRSSLDPKDSHRLPHSIQYSQYKPDKSNWYDSIVHMSKVQNIVRVLELADWPTIVGFQEFESAGNTSEVFSMPYHSTQTFGEKLSEMGYSYQLLGPQGANNPVSVTTAFISKIPLKNLTQVKVGGSGLSPSNRDVQIVKASIGGQELIVFNAHLKSKTGDGGAKQRIDAALEIHKRILIEKERNPYVNVIVLGDLNARFDDPALGVLGSTSDEGVMLNESSDELYNLWFDLPRNRRWEHSFDGLQSVLSHFLISDSLFNHEGLQYIEKSFRVIGQDGRASEELLSLGVPYSWQIYSYARGQKFSHLGKGFSDHLPIVAYFLVMSGHDRATAREKINLKEAHEVQDDDQHPPMIFPSIEACEEKTSLRLQDLNPSRIDEHIGACVSIDLAKEEPALALFTRGKYQNLFFTWDDWGNKSERANNKKRALDIDIGLSMTRSFDWRPNIDDSRISHHEAAIEPGEFNSDNPHPLSNKCFYRRVLSGPGGKLRRALGRLAYWNGKLNLMILSRESRYLILEDLPTRKLHACL